MNDIGIDITIPEDAKDDVMKFNETINQKYRGRMIDEQTKIELNYDIRAFEETLKAKYPYDKDIQVKLKGSLAYHETLWSIKDILEHYKQEYPERYVEQEEYSRMEVNNMLFELQIADVIGGYSDVAEPVLASDYNNEPFHETVTVLSRYE